MLDVVDAAGDLGGVEGVADGVEDLDVAGGQDAAGFELLVGGGGLVVHPGFASCFGLVLVDGFLGGQEVVLRRLTRCHSWLSRSISSGVSYWKRNAERRTIAPFLFDVSVVVVSVGPASGDRDALGFAPG